MFKPGDKVVAKYNLASDDEKIVHKGDIVTIAHARGLNVVLKEHPKYKLSIVYFEPYKPNFHLNYINLDVTVAEQVDKLEEEVKEVIDAVLNRDTENILEESMDVIQVILGLISTLELKEEFLEYNSQHQDKLHSRGYVLSRLV